MFSWYKYLLVKFSFSHLGFMSGDLFPSVPFPDRCLLVPLNVTSFMLCYSRQLIDIVCMFYSLKVVLECDGPSLN